MICDVAKRNKITFKRLGPGKRQRLLVKHLIFARKRLLDKQNEPSSACGHTFLLAKENEMFENELV